MSNPFFGNGNSGNTPVPNNGNVSFSNNGNPLQLMAQFREFSRNMNPAKAQQIIQQKLQSGEMSQEQFSQLQQQAAAFMRLFK